MLRRMVLPVLPVLVLVLLGPVGTPAEAISGRTEPPAATRSSATSQYTTAQFENRLLSRVNARRARIGCAKLRLVPTLTSAARGHSARMANSRSLSHQLSGEASFSTRITRAGYRNWRILAENIVYGDPQPPLLYNAWLHSPKHRANMDNCRLRDVGVGVSYAGGLAWATMDFGRRS
ncbi:CAP domain-containing protein [Marmoricola sp. RAF53]|uniref:CAP domain-containing protein n=1 Tax=Marmoricola sp. RAF53 TaxID=3233059 RepID=UPI003F970335